MPIQQKNTTVSWIASDNTWIEGEALRQLDATAALPGMRRCVGMPDLQPGKGGPSGAAFLADRIYPSLVGTDGGCGMGFWITDFATKRARPDRLAARLDGLDQPWDGDTGQFLADRGVNPTQYDASLGTPGYSNHFIELQELDQIRDRTLADALKIDRDVVYILVHSGSRGYGEAIFLDIAAKHGADGLAPASPESLGYLAAHDNAVAWADANRELCAQRVLAELNATGRRMLDICHNSVSPVDDQGCACWLHRKGAAPADAGPVIIPGSRNDLSFLVQPLNPSLALASLAHGAGRKIARKQAHAKLARLYPNKANLKRNRWGGQVVCGEADLLWEEAGECYKDATTVVADLETAGLLTVIATFRPIVTFKSSEGAKTVQHQQREDRQRERAQARADKSRR